MSLYDTIVDIDEGINKAAGGLDDTTLSKQDAYGIMHRRDYTVSLKEAKQIAHGNMLVAAGSLTTAVLLAKKNPWLALAFGIVGGIATSQVTKDWRTGGQYPVLRSGRIKKLIR